MDAEGLKLALATAAVSLSTPHLLEQLLMPLMTAIGNLWNTGSLRAAHEHMATAVVRSFMGALTAASRAERSGPAIVVTTPVGQLHELGALMVALASAVDVWAVTYMGPNLPAEEIAGAAHSISARAVALSIVYPPDDPQIGAELRTLRRLLPEEIALIVGGAAAPSYAGDLAVAAASVHAEIATFRTELRTLRHELTSYPQA
jgi:methanogenic corrinoid protein MtbC1